MRNNLVSLLGVLFLGWNFGLRAEDSLVEPDGLGVNELLGGSSGYKELGKYRVSSSTLVRLGKATELAKGEMVFRVFSDGVDVRISPEGNEESFLSFQIFRDSGIYDESGENLLPEPRMLTLTKFPTSSSNQEIIYAIRVSP